MRSWLVAVAVVIGFAASCAEAGSGDDDSSRESVVTLTFVDGEPADDVRRVTVSLGDRVEIEVVGDRDELVHVHGYDLYVEPNEASLAFDALIPGRFEIELEQSGRLLIELTVS